MIGIKSNDLYRKIANLKMVIIKIYKLFNIYLYV